MKILCLLFACLVTGCASNRLVKQPDATLSFVAGDRLLDPASGIWAIDDSYIQNGPLKFARIPAGRRKIGYICPGLIVVDDVPTVWNMFQAGAPYEMYCKNGRPLFRIKQRA